MNEQPGLLTTDLSLGYIEAYRFYSRCWSQEVSIGLFGLDKCQSQIASTSLVELQYNILFAVKRFMDYENIGSLQTGQSGQPRTDYHRKNLAGDSRTGDCHHQSILIADEEVIDALVNESYELAHIFELYQCKMTS